MLRWWQFRERRQCQHLHRRCVHGDEINWRDGKRSRCLRCGRFLPDLPPICSETGGAH